MRKEKYNITNKKSANFADLKGNSFIRFSSKKQILPSTVRGLNTLFISRHEPVPGSNSLSYFWIINLVSTRNVILLLNIQTFAFLVVRDGKKSWDFTHIPGKVKIVVLFLGPSVLSLWNKLNRNSTLNRLHPQSNHQCTWLDHWSDLWSFHQFTFVSWSANFDKLLNLNFNFCWCRLGRSFFGLLGCPASSGANKKKLSTSDIFDTSFQLQNCSSFTDSST